MARGIHGFGLRARVRSSRSLTARYRFMDIVTQGYMKTNDNNYLTMNTSSGTGSFAMTDAAVNLSTSITDKLHIGAQVYDRNRVRSATGIRSWTGRRRLQNERLARISRRESEDGVWSLDRYPGYGLPAHLGAVAAVGVYPADLRGATSDTGRGSLWQDSSETTGRLGVYGLCRNCARTTPRRIPLFAVGNGGHFTIYGGLQMGEDMQWIRR